MVPKKCGWKTKVSLLALGVVFSAMAQTNWPAYRQVNGQVYNVSLSPAWQTVIPRSGFAERGLDQSKSPGGQLLTVSWSETIGRTSYIRTVKRVPYSPHVFRVKKGSANDLEPVSIPYRVFLLKGETNWPPDGIFPRSVHLTYDYGVPAGTKEK